MEKTWQHFDKLWEQDNQMIYLPITSLFEAWFYVMVRVFQVKVYCEGKQIVKADTLEDGRIEIVSRDQEHRFVPADMEIMLKVTKWIK